MATSTLVRMFAFQSRRDCGLQPRVARHGSAAFQPPRLRCNNRGGWKAADPWQVRGFRFASVLFALAPILLAAQTAIDEEAPWPRVRSTNGNTVTLHLPQVERWTSNWFVARAVVEVKPLNAKKESLGVIWFEAHGSVDRTNRLVTLERFEVTKGRFPEATDGGSNALKVVRDVIPSGARTVSLDYLITALRSEERR